MRTALLLRRGWRATIFLALLAGLAGGIAMAAWGAGRRASTAFDRFVAESDPPELIVNFCPPELEEINEATLPQCFTYDAADERARLARLPEVVDATRVRFTGLVAARPDEPERTWVASSVVAVEGDVIGFEGHPVVVAGRLPRGDAPEVLVNERFRAHTGVGVGDELTLTFWSMEEMGASAADGDQFHGPQAHVRVVGVGRGARDLAASVGTTGSQMDDLGLIGGQGLAEATAPAGFFGGVFVDASTGQGATTIEAINRAFAGQQFNVSPHAVEGSDDFEPIDEAIRYEARGMLAFAAVSAVAAMAFAAQAVARQSRREWVDGETLRAIGFSDRDAGICAIARGAAIGLIAAATACAIAVALSPLGPVGVSRRAEIDPGLVADGVVLLSGATLMLVTVTIAAWFPVARQFRSARRSEALGRRRVLGAVQGWLPPPASAGVGMTFGGRNAGGLPIGTALASVALAVMAGFAAIGVTASLDALRSEPERFGAPWDISFGGVTGDPERLAAGLELVASDPDVEAASGIVGSDFSIGDEVAWVHAFVPVEGVDGLVTPVITSGRAPAGADEIALGRSTMSDQGLSLGDTVEVRSTTTRRGRLTMTVVGTTIVNDSYEDSPGRGGVMTLAGITQLAPEVLDPDPYVLRLADDADVASFQERLDELVPGTVSGPVQQGAIRNVARIQAIPYALAALVAVLAVASLAHALVLSVRRQRGQLAVLKSLGFRRGQVRATVASHATLLVVLASLVGAPIGVIIGRWGWRFVADTIGVASAPVTPLLPLLIVVVGVVVVANLVAAWPAQRAARIPTAHALRVE